MVIQGMPYKAYTTNQCNMLYCAKAYLKLDHLQKPFNASLEFCKAIIAQILFKLCHHKHWTIHWKFVRGNSRSLYICLL